MSESSGSRWTHILCDSCYQKQEPNRIPHRMIEEYRKKETCCSCGQETFSGIFYRASPLRFEHCNHHVSS